MGMPANLDAFIRPTAILEPHRRTSTRQCTTFDDWDQTHLSRGSYAGRGPCLSSWPGSRICCHARLTADRDRMCVCVARVSYALAHVCELCLSSLQRAGRRSRAWAPWACLGARTRRNRSCPIAEEEALAVLRDGARPPSARERGSGCVAGAGVCTGASAGACAGCGVRSPVPPWSRSNRRYRRCFLRGFRSATRNGERRRSMPDRRPLHAARREG